MKALAAQRGADTSLDHDDPVEEVFEDQIACADLVILSKSDLLDETGAARARAVIDGNLSRIVKVVPTTKGRIDPAVLLGLGLAVEDDIENRHTHHDDEEEHDHDEFDSFVVDLPAITDPDDLAERVRSVAEAHEVLRAKGFIEVSGKPLRLVVQAVGQRVSYYYDRPWTPGETRRSSLVVIGLAGIDRDAIRFALAG
jgi:cobalamin biosynthesis protein CobW